MTRELEILTKHFEEVEREISGFNSTAYNLEQFSRAAGAVQLLQMLHPEQDEKIRKLWDEEWYEKLTKKIWKWG